MFTDSSDKLCADVAAPGPLARTSKTPHVPRYFILHSDGTGSELLRDIDVAEFLEQAQKDPISAVLKSPVEGHPDVTGLTILRPHSGILSYVSFIAGLARRFCIFGALEMCG